MQHAAAGVPIPAPFDSFTGNFESPFREDDILVKLDWQATKSVHVFYRFNFFQNDLIPSFGPPSFSFFANKNRTQNHVVGSDFNTGTFTHSFRFEYLKFVNNIADAVRGSNAPLADEPVALLFPNNGLATGPTFDAPQRTIQSDHQLKYDGSKVWGAHILRYGAAFNHIQGGGFASFFGVAPLVEDFQKTAPPYNFVGNIVTCPGGQTGMNCPLNYVPDEAIIGNGLGFSTENPAFGFPFGGLGPDQAVQQTTGSGSAGAGVSLCPHAQECLSSETLHSETGMWKFEFIHFSAITNIPRVPPWNIFNHHHRHSVSNLITSSF